MMGHTSQLVSCCIFTAHLIDNDVREWPLCTTSLLCPTRKYIHVLICWCITSYPLFGNGMNWTTSNCRSFFRGGTFLEDRVTYGGVDSGAICKEPVQAMVSHHHPQSLSWKITLKYGKWGLLSPLWQLIALNLIDLSNAGLADKKLHKGDNSSKVGGQWAKPGEIRLDKDKDKKNAQDGQFFHGRTTMGQNQIVLLISPWAAPWWAKKASEKHD